MINTDRINRVMTVMSLCFIFFGSTGQSLVAQTPVNLKIAFVGDSGLGSGAKAVFNLIKSEGADILLHLGDFDYKNDPAAWEAQIDEILGKDFPFFACIGNHDEKAWIGANGYQQYLIKRMERLNMNWVGDLGVQSSFYFKGIFFVLASPGISDSGNDEFIREQLSNAHSLWRICAWHKNQNKMQVGLKLDEAGWGVYEEARKGGAIIATAHEHSYSRSHLLSDINDQKIASRSDTLRLTRDNIDTEEDEGKTFVFVSGLGGESIRLQLRGGDWWARVYSANQGANHGAVFGIFNYNAIPNLAKFYFKDIDGVIADSFYVAIQEGPVTGIKEPPSGIIEDYVLDQNYPNPFNPETEIRFRLPEANHVVLKIFDILGREIKTLLNAPYGAGSYHVRWNGRDKDGNLVASGVFVYRLQAGNFTRVKKMILLR